MARHITSSRKTAYYLGTGLMVLGLLLFASVFLTFTSNFGDFSNFGANTRSEMFRAIGGVALVIAGQMIRRVGARGLAGSGVLLDPEKARQELEPYSRMAGGMVKDALEEANVNVGARAGRVVMVKCPSCGRLNEEDSRFCQECGTKI